MVSGVVVVVVGVRGDGEPSPVHRPIMALTYLLTHLLTYLPVHGPIMALVSEDLRCEIVGRAAEGPCLVGDLFRKAEVHQHEVAVGTKEEVLELEVTVS